MYFSLLIYDHSFSQMCLLIDTVFQMSHVFCGPLVWYFFQAYYFLKGKHATKLLKDYLE